MDYVQPPDQLEEILLIAEVKANLSIPAMLIRGALSGAVLAFATLFAWKGTLHLSPTLAPWVGALVFPFGFAVVTLMAFELVTGNFAVVTLGQLRGRVSMSQLWRNWLWVALGNLIGSILCGFLIAFVFTNGFTHSPSDPLIAKLISASEQKTLFYRNLGFAGWWLAFVKGVLCNFLVGLASVLALTSRSSFGRMASIWPPIAIFFGLGFEHSVVNMFVIPTGMMLGSNVGLSDWWIWNQIPVTLGNLIGAALFVAGAIHWSTPKSPSPSV